MSRHADKPEPWKGGPETLLSGQKGFPISSRIYSKDEGEQATAVDLPSQARILKPKYT